MAVALVVSASCAWAAPIPITYNLVNYPLLQDGATLTGTITTDGTTGGNLPGSIIQSWQLTVTGGGSPFSMSSSDPNASALGYELNVTPTTLSIGWLLRLESATGTLLYNSDAGFYYAGGPLGPSWLHDDLIVTGLDGSGGWTVATSLSAVPEPSEWAAISFGVLGFVWLAKRRFMPARSA